MGRLDRSCGDGVGSGLDQFRGNEDLRISPETRSEPMNVLVRARNFLGWTQAEMAESLGLSLRTYQRREKLADEYIAAPEHTHAKTLVALKAVEGLEGETV